jgi:rubrerythrin
MATLWKHYSLRKLVEEFASGKVDLLHGLRCSNCSSDFHCDLTPSHCPVCGESFVGEARFGQRLPEHEKIREDKILAMLKEIKVTAQEILSLAQQETQDIATLKALTQAVATKVQDAAKRMNDAIAALTNGTANAAQLTAIASEMANHHNELQALADALNSVGSTADAEQPPAPPVDTPPATDPVQTTDTPATPDVPATDPTTADAAASGQ